VATKMTMFFNLFEAGFSETFYHTNNDPVALKNLIPNSFYQAAAAVRDRACRLKAVRFSQIGGNRLSILHRPYPPASGTRGFGGLTTQADVVSTTAVFQLSGFAAKTRRVWCRGLADGDVLRNPDGSDDLNAAVSKLFDAYFGKVASLQFQIRYILRPPDIGLTWRKVVAVQHLFDVSPNRASFFLSEQVPALLIGSRVSFDNIPSTLPHFPRSAEIINGIAQDGINNYIIAYSLPGGVTVGPPNLRLTAEQYGLSTITDWSFERFGEHKTGRPFGSLRGRSRAVRL